MRILIIVGLLILSIVFRGIISDSGLPQGVLIICLVLIGVYQLEKIDLFWRLYAYVYAALAITSIFGFLFFDYSTIDYIGIPVDFISSLGVLLFVYEKPFIGKTFWRSVLIISVLYSLVSLGKMNDVWGDVNEAGILGITLVFLLMALVEVPKIVALLIYSSSSNHIWKSKIEGDSNVTKVQTSEKENS